MSDQPNIFKSTKKKLLYYHEMLKKGNYYNLIVHIGYSSCILFIDDP